MSGFIFTFSKTLK